MKDTTTNGATTSLKVVDVLRKAAKTEINRDKFIPESFFLETSGRGALLKYDGFIFVVKKWNFFCKNSFILGILQQLLQILL